MKKTIYRLSVVAAALAAVLLTAQCAKEIDPAAESKSQDSIGDGIEVTLTATKGEDTRTELTASGAEMTVTWSTGDKIYVVGETDGLRGSLTLSSGANTKTATFKGCISHLTAKQNVRFYYLGKSDATISEDTFTLDISSQEGTLDGIENTMHLMCGTLSNVSPSTISFGDVTMSNLIAIGKFDLMNCTGFDVSKDITLTATYNKGSLDLKTGVLTGTNDGDITLAKRSGMPHYYHYIAMIPGTTATTFKQGSTAIAFNPASATVAGKFYSEDNTGEPIEVGIETYKYYDGSSVFRGYGRVINGLVWAPVNCGYKESNDSLIFGLIYQWGRKYGQPYVKNQDNIPWLDTRGNGNEDPATFYRSPSGESEQSSYQLNYMYDWLKYGANDFWNKGSESSPAKGDFDPCPSGWRVPTGVEMLDLCGSYSTSGAEYIFQKKPVLKTGKHGKTLNQNGCYFDRNGNPSSGFPQPFLFLPVAGDRAFNTSTPDGRNTYGTYWTSKTVDGASYTNYGVYLLFFNPSTSAAKLATNPRASGASVRCVRLPGTVSGTQLPGVENTDIDKW